MKTVLCYGDSNTHGTMPIDFNLLEKSLTPSKYRYPREERWTYTLQKELGLGYYVIEEGLNGRTTVWDDPTEGSYKNGLKYLLPCLESHAPIDLVILMLGINDFKNKFSLSAFDVAMGIGVLVNTIQKSDFGPNSSSPHILLLCPPPIERLSELKGLFSKGVDESRKLSIYLEKVAKQYQCSYLDTKEFIKASDIDGLHFDGKDLNLFGIEIAKVVRKII